MSFIINFNMYKISFTEDAIFLSELLFICIKI